MSKVPGQRCDQKNIWVASESPLYVAPESPLQESPLSPPTTLASEVFSPLGGSALPPLALFGCSHASDRPAVLCGASGVSPRLGFLGCCRGNGCGQRPQWYRFGGPLHRDWVVFALIFIPARRIIPSCKTAR